MTQADTPPTGSNHHESTTPQDEICPYCGHPPYKCECPDRWEDEGGASLPSDGTA